MKKIKDNSANRFLKSAIAMDGKFCSHQEALNWIQKRKKEINVNIELTNLSRLNNWRYNNSSGRVEHDTGKFFSIDGIDIHIESYEGQIKNWSQPIINQPEIGYLGCIVKEFDGVLYFLVQAKIEPGNENVVQISPTLQATKSNYTKVHKGNAPMYLNYFNEPGKSKILIDQLQSEQGSRFLSKRNRNIIIEVSEEIEVSDNFKWLTLGQIKKLIDSDNVVNMDLRTVISCISFNEVTNDYLKEIKEKNTFNTLHSNIFLESLNINSENCNTNINEIISWFTELKSKTDLKINKVRLDELRDWSITDQKISHINDLYFDVLWVHAEIVDREVASWDQPILAPSGIGVIAFIVKKIKGVYHFLVQAELECGNLDLYELGPTVSCVEENHAKNNVPFLEYVLSASDDQIIYSSLQSEEGGRFYHEQNKNLIIEVEESFHNKPPYNFKWISYGQLLYLLKFNNILNIGARSLLASIKFE